MEDTRITLTRLAECNKESDNIALSHECTFVLINIRMH